MKNEESKYRRYKRPEKEKKNSVCVCQKGKLGRDVHKRQESNLEQIKQTREEKKECERKRGKDLYG
jgi:hypothetical protein